MLQSKWRVKKINLGIVMNNISTDLLILDGEKALSKISQTPRLDSELLLANVLNVDRVQFYYKDLLLERKQIQDYESLLKKRMEINSKKLYFFKYMHFFRTPRTLLRAWGMH